MRKLSAGQVAYALLMVVLGATALRHGTFPAAWTPALPHIPAKMLFAYMSATIALLCGLALLWPRLATPATRLLFAWSLIVFLALHLALAFLAPRDIGSWYDVCEMAVVLAAAWALYVRHADAWDRQRALIFADDRGLRIARILFALSLVLFGVGHFVFLKETASLVPAYLPWHTAWAVSTACAFFAAAVAILTGICARLATILSAMQMGLFALLVYVPKVLHHTASPFQVNELVVSIALAVSAWVLAESYSQSRTPQ
jgi:uncharacterized membrane protein